MSIAVGIRTMGLRLASSITADNPLLTRSTSRLTPKRTLATTASVSPAPTKSSTSNKKQKVIIISGPTGAGKSRLALELARRLNGEIISADSVQVYQGLDIGSSKPSLTDRQEVPHHLLDILHPSEEYSVGQFFEDARKATKDILENGRVPIVTGGTGLYLRWYIYGKPEVPKASPEIASEVHSEMIDLQRSGDWDAAVQLVVKAGDPKAQNLAYNDWYRLKRTFEIIKATGSPPSAFQVPYDSFKDQVDSRISKLSMPSDNEVDDKLSKDLDYDFVCFFLSSRRLDLYRLIDLRCENMLLGREGILSEVTELLNIGLLPNSNSATRAIGYRQGMEYLLKCQRQEGRSSPGEFFYFLSEFQKASRNFAKRQLTWFHNEHIYHWLDASQPLNLRQFHKLQSLRSIVADLGISFREKVIDFIYTAYNDKTGEVVVPDSLQMKKEIKSRREISDLKAYRTKNRHFHNGEDCSEILDWIRTQRQYKLVQ